MLKYERRSSGAQNRTCAEWPVDSALAIAPRHAKRAFDQIIEKGSDLWDLLRPWREHRKGGCSFWMMLVCEKSHQLSGADRSRDHVVGKSGNASPLQCQLQDAFQAIA